MKILHVADLHFRQPWFEWVAAQASAFDAVCIAGDLLNMWITRDVPLRAQTKWIRDWARYRFTGRLFVCSGNHDWWTNDEITDTDANGGWLRKLGRDGVTYDNHGASIGDVYFFCHAYAARAPLVGAETKHWILLHHEPPAGCAAALTGDSGADLGSSRLREQIAAAANPPLLVLSGHVHRPKSWRGEIGRSTVLNPTYDEEASFPNHLNIDSSSGLITWVSERRGEWPLKILSPIGS